MKIADIYAAMSGKEISADDYINLARAISSEDEEIISLYEIYLKDKYKFLKIWESELRNMDIMLEGRMTDWDRYYDMMIMMAEFNHVFFFDADGDMDEFFFRLEDLAEKKKYDVDVRKLREKASAYFSFDGWIKVCADGLDALGYSLLSFDSGNPDVFIIDLVQKDDAQALIDMAKYLGPEFKDIRDDIRE